jgi:RimJ/RimL family protein N-acetyltransferase
MQPTLITARLQLRPAQPDDVDALWRRWTDPGVRRYLWDDRAITREEAAAALADCRALGAQGLGLWLVWLADAAGAAGATRPSGDSARGCAGLLPVSTAADYDARLAGLIEPLVALAPSAWGRGYASEALAELVRYAHARLGLDRLAGVTDVPNAASDRMLRRVGFRVLGEAPGPRHPLRTYLWQADATRGGHERSVTSVRE